MLSCRRSSMASKGPAPAVLTGACLRARRASRAAFGLAMVVLKQTLDSKAPHPMCICIYIYTHTHFFHPLREPFRHQHVLCHAKERQLDLPRIKKAPSMWEHQGSSGHRTYPKYKDPDCMDLQEGTVLTLHVATSPSIYRGCIDFGQQWLEDLSRCFSGKHARCHP